MTYRELLAGPTEADLVSDLCGREITEDNTRTTSTELGDMPGLRHLAAGGSETTLCGADRSAVSCVHPSKARKTDCPKCRDKWRTFKANTPSTARMSVRETMASAVIPMPQLPVKPPVAFVETSKDTRIIDTPADEPQAQKIGIAPMGFQPLAQEVANAKISAKPERPSPETPETDARVRELRATMVASKTGVMKPMSMRAIEETMGWPAQNGNRPWRICKRLGIA